MLVSLRVVACRVCACAHQSSSDVPPASGPSAAARLTASRAVRAHVAPQPPQRARPPLTPEARSEFAAAVAADLLALTGGGDVSAIARRGLEHAPLFALNTALSKLSRGKDGWQPALRLLRFMEASDSPKERPNEHTYAAFLSCCGAGPSLSAARSVWRRLTLDGTLPPPRVTAALLGALGRAAEVREAVELFERLGWEDTPRPVFLLNAALTACSQSGSWEAALSVWNLHTEGRDEPPDALSLSLLLTACIRGGQCSAGVDAALSRRGAGILLDSPAAACLMTAAGKCGRTKVAHATWNRLLSSRTPLTTWVCNSYLSALARSGDAERAREVLAHMRSHNVTPDVMSYTAAMEASCRDMMLTPEERLEDVRSGLDVLLAAGCEPTAHTLTMLLTALGDCGRWEEALEIESQCGIPRSTVTCNALMRACVLGGQPERAFTLFRDMQARQLLPSAVTFTVLLKALGGATSGELYEEVKRLKASLGTVGMLEDPLQPWEEPQTPPDQSFAPGAWVEPQGGARAGHGMGRSDGAGPSRRAKGPPRSQRQPRDSVRTPNTDTR